MVIALNSTVSSLAASWVRKNCKADKCWENRFFRIDHNENSQGMYISFLFVVSSFFVQLPLMHALLFSRQKDSGAIGKQIEDGVRLMGRGAEEIKWPIHLEVGIPRLTFIQLAHSYYLFVIAILNLYFLQIIS